MIKSEKAQAAYVLSDEIYRVMRDTQLAHLVLNDAFEYRLEDEDLDSADEFRVRRSYAELSWRMEILLEYVVKTKKCLEALDRLGRAYVPEATVLDGNTNAEAQSPTTEDKLLSLLTEAATTGHVSSKAVASFMRTVNAGKGVEGVQ